MRKLFLFLLLLTGTWCGVWAENYTVRFYSSGCETPQTVLAAAGEQVSVAVSPQAGYHFVRWSDGSTDNPRMVTISGNADYTAEYEPEYYTLLLYAEGCETPTTIIAPYGEQVTMTASAMDNSRFVAWSDGNTQNPRTVTVTGNASYTAQYAPNTYTITTATNDAAMGTAEGGATVVYGDTVTIVANANTGYQFNQWTDGNTDNPRHIVVTEDKTYTAVFGTKMCRLVLQSNIEEAADLTGEGTYAYGTTVTCTVDVLSGYEFVKWSNGKTYNPYKFKIYDSMTLTAFFREEEAPAAPDTTVVAPSNDGATIQWPQVDNAYTYTLTISKNGEVVCTLTFNALGQLININFAAPSRAENTATATIGFNFTITGLEPGTDYTYTIEAKDEQGETVSIEAGAFKTTGEATGINTPSPEGEGRGEAVKVLCNGRVLILRGGKVYDVVGQFVNE